MNRPPTNGNAGRALLLASGNRHKLQEMRVLLQHSGIELRGGDDVGGLPEVTEDGLTFHDNAVKKAVAVAARSAYPVIADDSGFSVAALGGAPGVFSARYAGDGASDQDNVAKLLSEMRSLQDRRASFVCVLAVATKRGLCGTVEGRVDGWVAPEPKGKNGFGYDPVFIPTGFQETFGQLPAAVKNRFSHRARAVEKLLASGLLQVIGSGFSGDS